jgi:hypothetical protein
MSYEDWLLDQFQLIHRPKKDEPWFELKYADPEATHKFIDTVAKLANMPRLSLEKAAFFFRGQADTAWSLKPSFCRQLEAADPKIKKKEALSIEFDSIRHFKARAHLYIAPQLIPHENDTGEWLTLMQHYRAPTRMLDWTTSLNVALYFAAADHWIEIHEVKAGQRRSERRKYRPGALWFFDMDGLLSHMEEKGHRPYSKERYAQIFAKEESFVAFGLKEARPNIWAYCPDVPTDRMLAQKGIHTFSEQSMCDHAKLIGKALWEYWEKQKSLKDGRDTLPLTKLVIPAKKKAVLREHLMNLDVHASTLFPGLDGVGNTLSEMIGLEARAYSQGRKVRQKETD